MKTFEQKKKENIHLFNKWAKSYDFPLFQFWMKKFHEPIEKELILTPQIKILDISCGTGELLLRWKGKALLTGIDLAEKMLLKAREKLPQEIKLLKADVHNLPFKKEHFNYVISTEAFHHYYDQKKALQEMIRVKKNEGKVIIVDINFFFHFIHIIFEHLEPGCVKVNDKKEMKKLFKDVGLTKISQKRQFLFAVMTVGTKTAVKKVISSVTP